MTTKPSHLKYNQNNLQNSSIFLKPKTQLNKRYIIKKPIFQSSQFISYIGFDEKINCEIIIKEFFPKSLVLRGQNNKVIVTKLENELKFTKCKNNHLKVFNIMQRFRVSQNTIKIFSNFIENNTIYCVQEIPQGLTLKTFLSNNYGELNWQQHSEMFLELLNFLQNLHDNNILHCGLSPETILVHNNKLKIIDFSNAIVDSQVFIIPPKLHDGYAPIEQYNNNLKLGTFTDVYAVAAIIYKSLTGTKPVSSISRTLNDNLIPPKNLNVSIPKNISVSIMSALILSSKLRTQTMKDFFDDLTAKSRDYYKNFHENNHHHYTKMNSTSSQSYLRPENQNFQISEHINTIEPIKKNNLKKKCKKSSKPQHEEMPTHSLIFTAMLISSSIVLFTAAIIIFIIFYHNLF